MPIIPNIRSHDNTTNHGIAKPIIVPHDATADLKDAASGPDLTDTASGPDLKDAASGLVPAKPQAFLDTPCLVYSMWNKVVGGIDQPLGNLPSTFSVCLIGGGISNLAAAFELAKAGATVTLYEADSEVGGRLRSLSNPVDKQNIAEMGAMRFPPSEDLLYYYAKSLGFGFMAGFPDPGVYPTVISYQGMVQEWMNKSSPPSGFETVYNGWTAFCSHGLTKDGQKMLQSANTLQHWLKNPLLFGRDVHTAWQDYLNTFKYNTFLEGLQRIFGSTAEWDIPGETQWTTDDFKRFGALGIGSGGFGPLYEVAFTTVFRLVPNGLETDQAIFCTPGQGDGNPTPAGIQQLALALKAKAISSGAKIVVNSVADVESQDTGSVVVSVTTNGGASTRQTFNFVIIGVTTRTMAINMSAGSNSSLFNGQSIIDGINDVHIISSSKLFIRTNLFWETKPADFPRNILSDTDTLPQLYTLSYGNSQNGMVLMTYTWEDQSNDISAFNDSKQLCQIIKKQATQIMKGSKYPNWADNLVPLSDKDYWLIHWQNEPHFNGAFVLGRPGNDPMTAAMFLDFLSLSQTNHPPILLNGDSISFTGGWIDGGLQCAMNAVSAVLKKYGKLSNTNGASLLAPVNLISVMSPYTYY